MFLKEIYDQRKSNHKEACVKEPNRFIVPTTLQEYADKDAKVTKLYDETLYLFQDTESPQRVQDSQVMPMQLRLGNHIINGSLSGTIIQLSVGDQVKSKEQQSTQTDLSENQNGTYVDKSDSNESSRKRDLKTSTKKEEAVKKIEVQSGAAQQTNKPNNEQV